MAGRVGTFTSILDDVGAVQNALARVASLVGWRARLRPASFRGVPFYVDEGQGDAGRRIAHHEYPERDAPWAEDLGRARRKWTVSGYVLGPTYPDVRDLLIAACETPGPGRLVHPYLGELQVVCDAIRYRERDEEGGICRFELTMAEPGTAGAPDALRAAGASLLDAATGLAATAVTAFASVFRVDGFQDFVAVAALANLGDLAAIVNGLQGPTLQVPTPLGVTARAAILAVAALDPAVVTATTIATTVVDAVAAFAGGVAPAVALDGLDALTTVGFPGPPTTATPARTQQAVNADALTALTHQAAAAALPAPVSTVPLDVYDDLATIRARVVTMCDRVEATASDAAFDALAAVRAEAVAELAMRGATLRPLRPYTTPFPRPALTLAHRLYRDAGRADEIVARTGAVHPAFVPDAGVVASS